MSKKKSRRFSRNEIRSYWIGVGVSAERHGDADELLESRNAKIRNSARKGYEEDNRKDLS